MCVNTGNSAFGLWIFVWPFNYLTEGQLGFQYCFVSLFLSCPPLPYERVHVHRY